MPLHKYGPRVWIVMDGGSVASTDKDGKKQTVQIRSSQVLWLPAQEHSLENIGAKPFRTISVELK